MVHRHPHATTVNRMVSFTLSQNEMRAFAGAATRGVPNLAKRFLSKSLFTLPFFVITYMLRNECIAENKRLFRKAALKEQAELDKAAAAAAAK